MQASSLRWMMSFFVLLFASVFIVIFINREALITLIPESVQIQTIKTVFISIVLEAVPFVLLGVLLSSFLHIFVSERTIQRFIPRNPFLGILFACLLGLLFPVCECGMIPVVRRLILKGMPIYMAAVFIFAGPVLNPIVFASTYMAFRNNHTMAYSRMGLAFIVAACIGLFVYRFMKGNPLTGKWSKMLTASDNPHMRSNMTNKPNVGVNQPLHTHAHAHHDDHGDNGHGHDHDHEHDHSHGSNKLSQLFQHASDEFIEMGKFLVFGALVTAAIQTFVAREHLISIGQGEVSSHLFMIGFAYILSLCSTSDAFVASSFSSLFTPGSILTFLVFGPMLDFKGTLMLLSVFNKRFVFILSILVIIFVLAGSMLFEHMILNS